MKLGSAVAILVAMAGVAAAPGLVVPGPSVGPAWLGLPDTYAGVLAGGGRDVFQGGGYDAVSSFRLQAWAASSPGSTVTLRVPGFGGLQVLSLDGPAASGEVRVTQGDTHLDFEVDGSSVSGVAGYIVLASYEP